MSSFEEEEENAAVVIDSGSVMLNAGFAGDDGPRSVFPSVIGRPRHAPMMAGVVPDDIYVGEDANIRRREYFRFSYPVENGIVTNWDDMERIWKYTFYNELRVAPEEHRVLFADAPLNPKCHRERMAQLMFEGFNVPGLYMMNQAVLSMYATGRTTGCVLDCGGGISNAVPVYDGFALTDAVSQLAINGRDLTENMMRLLLEIGHNFTSNSEREIVRDMKERITFVAFDYDEEIRKSTESSIHDTSYELPDGNIITLGNIRFKCPEILFQPNLIGKDPYGIHNCLFDSIMKCAVEVREELFSNIILSGGSTLFPGIAERLTKELELLVPSTTRVKVIAPPERKYSVWIGGSIWASLSTSEGMWITKEEYDETGPNIVHRKCFCFESSSSFDHSQQKLKD